ncbi:MAG: hypothetical protein F6K21_38250 [Symploca sp. SIO2D2]|nr:hypothetical protein [Symploca sp. SIO2D2]NER47410.1 hypothetical protein [Symploca sp. SIO1A3]
MATIKDKLHLAIASTPEPILEQVLDYLEYLKAKAGNSNTTMIEPGEPILRDAKAKDLLKFAGTWQGEDFEECLELVYNSRSEAQF